MQCAKSSPRVISKLVFAFRSFVNSSGTGTLMAPTRLLMAAYVDGLRMIAELMFYVLTALSFAVGIWFAVNLLPA